MRNQALTDYRRAKRLSMRKMAELVGVSASYYEKIELGVRNPSYEFICRFKKTFPEISADRFFFSSLTEDKA